MPFADVVLAPGNDDDDEGLLYDDIGGPPVKKRALAPAAAPNAAEPASDALPTDFDIGAAKRGAKDKDVLGVKARAPRPKLDENCLSKAEGLDAVLHALPARAAFRGKDAEQDAVRLVEAYRSWATKLFPRMPVDELVARVDGFGRKGRVRDMVEALRQNARFANWKKRKRDRGDASDDEPVVEASTLEEKRRAATALRDAKLAAKAKAADADGDDEDDYAAAYAEAAGVDAAAEAAMDDLDFMDAAMDAAAMDAAMPTPPPPAAPAPPAPPAAAAEDSEEEFDFGGDADAAPKTAAAEAPEADSQALVFNEDGSQSQPETAAE